MENQEDILDALRDFEKKPAVNIPPVLEQYLGRVASTGETLFPWPKMKPLFVKKLDEVMNKFQEETHMDNLPPSPNVENVKFDAIRSRILSAIDKFHGAPFTIQRLCELITDPKKHYKRADKFLRGVEKNILVVSTVDPFGRKVVSESKNLVNGLDSNGHMLGEGDATHESAVTTSTITPALPWPSPGGNAFAAINKGSTPEEDTTEDMQCSEDPEEISESKPAEVASLGGDNLAESDTESRLVEKSSESNEAATEKNSNQTDITSKDTETPKEQKVSTDQISDNDTLVIPCSQISDGSEAESTSPDSEKEKQKEESSADDKESINENVSSVSNSDETESVSKSVTENVDTSSNLADSSTTSKSNIDKSKEETGFTKDQESGGGDEAGKTEEPSSSDGEDSVSRHGDASIHSEASNGVLEEGISSSESDKMCETPVEPQPSVEASGEATLEKEDDSSPSQSYTAETPQNISEDACMSSGVATSDSPLIKSDIAAELSQDLSAEEKVSPAAEGGNVSSSSESLSVAMDTEDSSTRTSDSSENTSDSSASDNFCSTSDIPEPMEED